MENIVFWKEILSYVISIIEHADTTIVSSDNVCLPIKILSWKMHTQILCITVYNKPYILIRTYADQAKQTWYSKAHHESITIHTRPQHSQTEDLIRNSDVITSPLSGVVITIQVREGELVSCGTPLVIIESMKMQNEIRSPRDGIIETISTAVTNVVEPGQVLLTLCKKQDY